MKRFALMFVSALVCLCGCEKADVDINKLYGTWDECYDDKNFVMDGIVDIVNYVPQPKTVKLEPEKINTSFQAC